MNLYVISTKETLCKYTRETIPFYTNVRKETAVLFHFAVAVESYYPDITYFYRYMWPWLSNTTYFYRYMWPWLSNITYLYRNMWPWLYNIKYFYRYMWPWLSNITYFYRYMWPWLMWHGLSNYLQVYVTLVDVTLAVQLSTGICDLGWCDLCWCDLDCPIFYRYMWHWLMWPWLSNCLQVYVTYADVTLTVQLSTGICDLGCPIVGFLAPKTYIIGFSNLLILAVPNEGYSRNAQAH